MLNVEILANLGSIILEIVLQNLDESQSPRQNW